MWTRAPPFTRVLLDCSIVSSLALDQEEDGEACPRLHHNHQPGEQELEYTKPFALDYPFSHTTTIHHDLPEAAGSFKRLPTVDCGGGSISETCKLSHMSTPESTSVARVGQLLLPDANTSSKLVGCESLTERRQPDDMQTQIANAHTLHASFDQEVPELVVSLWSSPSKRRRLAHNEFKPKDFPDSLSPEACEDSGLTAEQHMADLGSSKASTPEDIDSAAAGQVSASLVAASDQLAAPQCSSTPPGKQVEQEKNHVGVSQVLEPRQLEPSDDDTQSTSQIHIWVPHFRGNKPPTGHHTKTMASGSDEWLQLSLGSRPSDEPPVDELAEPQCPTPNPPTSTTADPPQAGIRDFFKFGGHSEIEGHRGSTSTRNASSPYRAHPAASAHSGESPRRHHYSGTPESSHRSGTLPRPLTFLEPRPRTSRESPWVDPNVHIPRVPSGGNVDQFLSPSPVLEKSYNQQPPFSNLSTLPYHPARVWQPVRSQQTETTSVHAWRTGIPPSEAGASSSAPWMQPPGHHDPPGTPPNSAEFLSIATPGGLQDWRSGASPSFPSMQPLLAQGVDPEQAWRNLLQRVGNNFNKPSGFGAASSSSGQRAGGEAMMLPPGDREEHLDALTRAVERFQGADQGGKGEPLTELQRLQRNAMFPPGQRPHLGHTFDPCTGISLDRYFNLPPSSGSKQRAPALVSSSDRQRRIFRSHAPRAGLWFTLQASNSQPEASPLQQIPTAYIRVVDDNMTVAAVRRYLVNKLGLASEDEVELTCKGQTLQLSIPLSQVRDGIWQSPNTNTPNESTPQLLSEGKAWKAPDGSITLVGDVVMVLTYGRRPQAPPPTST